jgi:hypothetical protein
MNPSHALPAYFFKILSNILLSTIRSSKWFISFSSPNQTLSTFSLSPIYHMPHITHPAVFEDPNAFCKQNSVQLTVPSFLLTPEEYLTKSTTALDGDVTTEQRVALPTGTLTHCTRIQIDCFLRRAVKNLDKKRLLLATPCKQLLHKAEGRGSV